MAQNDFLEGVRKGMLAYMQTRQFMQQQESADTNQMYMRAMTEQMNEPKQPAWDSTPEGYRQKLMINKEVSTPPESPKPTSQEIADAVEVYNKQLAGTGYRGVYNPFKGTIERVKIATSGGSRGTDEPKPSIYSKYGVSEGDDESLDQMIRNKSDAGKGPTQMLGRNASGDPAVVKIPQEPSPQIDPAKMTNSDVDDYATSMIAEFGLADKNGAVPEWLKKQVKSVMARRNYSEKMEKDLRSSIAVARVVDVDNAALLAKDKELADDIRKRVDKWYTNQEPIFPNFPVPSNVAEASAQVREYVSMARNAGASRSMTEGIMQSYPTAR